MTLGTITLAATTSSDASAPIVGLTWVAWWIGCMFLAAHIAKRKGRQPAPWVIFAFFLNWIALIAVALMPPGSTYTAPNKISPERQREIGEQLLAIQNDNLTPFVPPGVMPQHNEQFFWEQRAQYGQSQTQRVNRGSTPALYVPLGHGIRARVGGYQGTSQVVTNFTWGPLGTVYVSNMRVLFKSDDGNVAQAPFQDIVTYDAFPNGLSLNLPKIGIMQFRTGDECLGAVFLRMVKGPAA